MTWWDPVLTMRVTINSLLCLGRGKDCWPHSQHTLLHKEFWGEEFSSWLCLCTSGTFFREKRRLWVTEERCCSSKKGWVVFRTYQPQLSAYFCEILIESYPLLLGKSWSMRDPRGKVLPWRMLWLDVCGYLGSQACPHLTENHRVWKGQKEKTFYRFAVPGVIPKSEKHKVIKVV